MSQTNTETHSHTQNPSNTHGDPMPSGSTAPSSPMFAASTGRVNSTIRFSNPNSHHHSNTPSTSSRSNEPTSEPSSRVHSPSPPSSGSPSRPNLPNRGTSAYTSGWSYKRPISTQSTLNFRRAYPSTKLRGEIEKPWTKYPDPAHRWARIIFWICVGLGFAIGGVSKYRFISARPLHKSS